MDTFNPLMLYNVAIPLITGGIFCFILLLYKLIFLIAPATLIFYGRALLNAANTPLPEIQMLGISKLSWINSLYTSRVWTALLDSWFQPSPYCVWNGYVLSIREGSQLNLLPREKHHLRFK
jgi:hypothetical protein